MINERLRVLRKKNHLTLKELGERTALSPAYLSNLENGKTSPTIDNLEKICFAMQYEMNKLVSESKEFQPLVRKGERVNLYRNIYFMKNELMTPPGVFMRGTCITLFDNDDTEHISIGHEHDEYFVVSEGHVKVMLNETDEYHMEAGDAIYIREMTPHVYQREGKGPAVLLITTAMI